MITIFDLETTGLLEPKGTDLSNQPHIIEIYAVQLNNKLEKVKDFHSLIKPPIPIPNFITKITHIDDPMVKDAPMFSEVFQEIVQIFFKSHTSIGHNLSFDEGVLACELERIDKQYSFPWCPIKYCTVEQSMHIKGHRLKNSELYEELYGKPPGWDLHRAKNDVRVTFFNYKALTKCG